MPQRSRVPLRCAAVAAALLMGGQSLADEIPPLPAPNPEVYLDRSGLNELLLNQAFFGMQLGSALTTNIFDNPNYQSSGFILGLAGGIAVPLLLTQGKPVPSGEVVYINQLQRLGIANGGLFFGLLTARSPVGALDIADWRLAQGLMAAGNLLGLGAAAMTADVLDLMPGQAGALGNGYLYGAFTGVMLLRILDVVESDRAAYATVLATANAGLVAAFLLRDYFAVDRARLMWTNVGAAIGAGAGAVTGALLGGEDVDFRFVSGMALAGFWTGAAVTYLYLVPPEGYRERADLHASLVGIDDRGRVSMGVPTPSAMVLPAREAGGQAELATTVNLLEWRSR